ARHHIACSGRSRRSMEDSRSVRGMRNEPARRPGGSGRRPAMAYVVTARCVDCRYTYCLVTCPMDCFWEITAPHRMLVIDPGTCIDCDACIPECPVNAIWPDTELPDAYASWTAFNAEHYKEGTQLFKAKRTEGSTDPLPTARLLED